MPESYGVAVRRGATTVFAPHADSTGDNQNASPTGFEPVISTVTGWRALQTAPRGRVFSLQVAQVGLDPTASLRPTLRVGARAKVVCQLPTEPSCVPQAGFEPATARRPRSTAVPRLELTSGSSPPPVFKTGSSSSRITSVCFSCGSWSRTNIETFRVSCPTVRRPRSC